MSEDTRLVQAATITGTELQLLVSMLSGLGTDVREGFARVDAKLEQMIPRPEFEAFQKSTDLRFAALERSVRDSVADHATIRAEAETAETRLDAKISVVAVDVAASETSRLREFKGLNMKLWGVLGGAGVTIGTGVLLAYINSQP